MALSDIIDQYMSMISRQILHLLITGDCRFFIAVFLVHLLAWEDATPSENFLKAVEEMDADEEVYASASSPTSTTWTCGGQK